MLSHNQQKKMAVINDFTGFGRCSLTVSIPIISHMGVQCCPVPTSVFSNHTAFSSWYFDDYTEKMPNYIAKWKELGLRFDGIQTGFLGSLRQIEIVKDFIRDFRDEGTIVIVDPVMGDNGTAYATYTPELCSAMKELAAKADILTPNVTEACILTDIPYKENGWTTAELFALAESLTRLGAEKIVLSGVPMKRYIGNVIYEKGGTPKILRSLRVGHERCGTGDIFASILAADAVNGVTLESSVRKAMKFIKECILVTELYQTPATDGACFEDILYKLR